MTENEALEILNNECEDISKVQVALKVAREALAEIQQYRKLGTVEEVKYLVDSYNGMIHDFGDDMCELKQYRAIGTIEEFKALKEKDVHIVTGEWIDTQPQHNNGYYKNAHVCSNCNDYYTTEYDEMKFCPNCGAKMTET